VGSKPIVPRPLVSIATDERARVGRNYGQASGTVLLAMLFDVNGGLAVLLKLTLAMPPLGVAIARVPDTGHCSEQRTMAVFVCVTACAL
jgi:hypothetical protein